MLNGKADPRPVGNLHVAELARLTEVTPATVRYYSRVGLLRPDREHDNGYRCYSAADTRRLNFIRRAQSLGLTIGDIKSLLATIDAGEMPCQQVRALVENRLREVREQLEQLKSTEQRIARALASWEDLVEELPSDSEFCPLIEHVEPNEVSVRAAGGH